MMFYVGRLKDANGRHREAKREMELERKDQKSRGGVREGGEDEEEGMQKMSKWGRLRMEGRREGL